MANPTTNYGFVLPTPTDLVTDLPADFDVALQGVDTRLKALQPGTTLGDLAYSSATANTNTRLPIGTSGQVLAVSGGGVPAWTTTADVTPLTTKGDLFTFTTVDARIGVGANGTVLTADSAEATGLKWATPASGSTFSGASVYKNTSQSIATGTAVTATWQVEDFDVDGYWSSGAATRLTIPTGKSGKFVISGRLTYTHNATGMRAISLSKNGSGLGGPNVQTVTESGIGVGVTASWIVNAVATDYFELVYNQRSGSTLTSEPGGGIYYDIFSIAYLGA